MKHTYRELFVRGTALCLLDVKKKYSILNSEHERIVTELCVDTLQVGICSIAYKTSQCLSWVEFVFLDVDPS